VFLVEPKFTKKATNWRRCISEEQKLQTVWIPPLPTILRKIWMSLYTVTIHHIGALTAAFPNETKVTGSRSAQFHITTIAQNRFGWFSLWSPIQNNGVFRWNHSLQFSKAPFHATCPPLYNTPHYFILKHSLLTITFNYFQDNLTLSSVVCRKLALQ
jgi:hypothetical protein